MRTAGVTLQWPSWKQSSSIHLSLLASSLLPLINHPSTRPLPMCSARPSATPRPSLSHGDTARRLAIHCSEVLLRLLFSSALPKKHATGHPSLAWHGRSSGLHVHTSSTSCCCESQDWLQYYRKLSAGRSAELRCRGRKVTEDTGTQSCSGVSPFACSDFHWYSH